MPELDLGSVMGPQGPKELQELLAHRGLQVQPVQLVRRDQRGTKELQVQQGRRGP